MTTEKLEELVNEHGTALYRFCLNLTRSKEDADDLYQSTFLKAFERLQMIQEDENPKGYLFTICINLWKSERRKRMTRYGEVILVGLEDAALLDAGVDVEDFVIAREQIQMITAAADDMDDRHRIPLYLYYSAELSIPEIAASLKIPEGTVKSRLYKARITIQKNLGVNIREQGNISRGSVQAGTRFKRDAR